MAWALLEVELGNEDKARELFEAGAAADPSHGPLHSSRAKFEAKFGSAEHAREMLRDAVAKYPSSSIYSSWGALARPPAYSFHPPVFLT